MRIACAQFSSQLGDVDNNLTRADAVLLKARPEQLEDLDLLVLPELAFTGFRFRSLQQIHPFLEPSGSGISSLWARTTALKYSTNVLVGYPEKVDVRDTWPASPEYYNSAVMVNDDGETVFNYRKNFLGRVDRHWALESDDGFLECNMPGLGKVCVALGVDLNPYSPDPPWHAFEIASHALEIGADVVIVCMSWPTRKEAQEFSQTLDEPDMDTLTSWVQRLEPLVRAELSRETIVVFCNRSGQEADALYAGTSAVVGIKDGEVSVYSLAGRGTKEFLFVDTSMPPFAKLVQNDEDDYAADNMGEFLESGVVPTRSDIDSSRWTVDQAKGLTPPPPRMATPAQKTVSSTGPGISSATSSGHSRPAIRAGPARRERPSPQLRIPEQHNTSHSAHRPHSAESQSPTTFPTPTAPSPTPMPIRPKLIVPEQGVVAAGFSRKPSPFPHDKHFLEQHRFFGNHVHGQTFEPVTPMDNSTQASTQASTRFYWKPSDTLLKTPADMNFSFVDTAASDLPIESRAVEHDAIVSFSGKVIPSVTAKSGRRGSLSYNYDRESRPSLRHSEKISPYEAALPSQMERTKSATDEYRLGSRDAQRDYARHTSSTEDLRSDIISEQRPESMSRPSFSHSVSAGIRTSTPNGVRSYEVRKGIPEDESTVVGDYVDSDGEQRFNRTPSTRHPGYKHPSKEGGRATLSAHCNLQHPQPDSHMEDDEDDDSKTQSPGVLDGAAKTSVITVQAGSLQEITTSSFPSATSVTSMVSQPPKLSEAIPSTTGASPYPSQIPGPEVTGRLLIDEKRVDAPIPSVCESCGSPRTGLRSAKEGNRPRSSFW